MRRGFTLVEVLLALMVGGMTIALAHQILILVGTAAEFAVDARRSRDLQHNGRRWLRAALSSIDAPREREPFVGLHSELQFTAATLRGWGWFAPERLRVSVRERQLVVERGGEGTMILADSVDELAIDYLHRLGADERWGAFWISEGESPLAVRFRLLRRHGPRQVDTAVYLIRDRR